MTGAGSGIGAAVALALARNGASVAVNDLRPDAATATAEKIASMGGVALAVVADVTDPPSVSHLFATAVERFGTIDILVTCAGVLRSTRFEDIGESEWDLVLDVNLKGTFLCCQAALPIMKARRSGKVVIVASLAGRATSTLGGAHYTASKAGALGLARHLARETAPFGVNVNAVNPGVIDTPMVRLNASTERLEQVQRGIPFGRLGTPEEVADLVVFLASDESRYITGAAIDIHGGELII